MSRSVATSPENNFRAGLITEATGLNFPENACVDTYDCVFDFTGTARRRPGIDFETFGTTISASRAGSVINTYIWRNVTGDGTLNFVVTQIGNKLYYYDTGLASLSSGIKAHTTDLTTFTASGGTEPRLNDCQFSDGLGKLIVVHPQLEPFFVTYDQGTGLFAETLIPVSIRDFEGQVDNQVIDARVASPTPGLSIKHHYNLLNQGWSDTNTNLWITNLNTVPSNCDVMWTFKNASDVFVTTTVANVMRGNTPAPKGHYVLNLFNQNRDAASGLTGTVSTTTGSARPSTTAFFQGRAWYAGLNYTGFTSQIFFSQIIERDEQLGWCYQQSDPTAETLFDLLPSDGGVIKIPEAGTIYKLWPLGGSLLVFALRGVWLITGSTGLGFTANDYTVTKISSFKTVSASSFVDVNGSPMYWNTDGIFQLSGAQQAPSVESMTFTTIQSFYDLIPNTAKTHARGIFNPLDYTVTWLFSSTSPGSLEATYQYDRALVYNTQTKAFYPWTISPSTALVHSIVQVDSQGGTITETNVVNSGAVLVVNSGAVQVISNQISNANVAPKVKLLTSYPGSPFNFTWSEFKDLTYQDWNSVTPVLYTSYFLTGYKTHGDAMRKFQANLVNVFNEGTGKFYLSGVWDYSLTGNNGRYSSLQLCDFNKTDYSNAHKRVKVRGNGITLQYKVTSIDNQPFDVIGWSTYESANALP